MFKAMFIGKDGSMGFKHGAIYIIETHLKSTSFFSKKAWIWVRDIQSGNQCPYESLESMLVNWELLDN